MSAWGKIQSLPEPLSLDEISSEQLAQSLQEREIRKHASAVIQEVPEKPEDDIGLIEVDQTESDAAIATMLQHEINKEHDLMLKRTEQKYNGNSKVNISFANYRAGVGEPEEPIQVDDDEKRDFDRFVSIEKEIASIPRCGYKKVSDGDTSQIVTKHDIPMSSRLNACRVLQFPPGIQTGDTGGFDMKINNNVFNSLRRHSQAFSSREKAKAHLKPDAKTHNSPKPAN